MEAAVEVVAAEVVEPAELATITTIVAIHNH
jgi:hypothetical protein